MKQSGIKNVKCFWLIMISCSLDPQNFVDPDTGSQNVADPTYPDPKH